MVNAVSIAVKVLNMVTFCAFSVGRGAGENANMVSATYGPLIVGIGLKTSMGPFAISKGTTETAERLSATTHAAGAQ